MYFHPAYLSYMQTTSCEMPGLMKFKLESRLPGEISIPQICRRHHPNGRKQRGTKEPLDGSEKRSEKASLKLNSQKIKIMTYGPITSWQTEGEKMQAVTDFIFLGSKITVDSDCSHEFKRHLLLG